MKKHILQENYERMFGSIKEDWWDDMDASAQAQYIKDHPGSKRAQSAKDTDGDEDDYDMGVVPGSRELDDTPEDDSEKGSSLTSAPGRVPDEDEPDYGPEHPDNMDDDELKQFLDKDAEEDEGEPYKREPFQPGDDPEELSLGAAQDELEKAQAEMAHAEEMGDKAAYADAEEKEYALQVRLGITGRTGNELNQETLTIDGKQYRRISEGVEKQPKPKYAFSEFYERFKK